ncbi:MAG: SDR family oxidoreductase [Pseudomonadales bacterium]|nr:SDR family oxidoreductase [Halioglobus sp.]MCP5123410.1 SDR family oxidoreductase [Pseudomonadales bacterium]MCP5193060.1 SDR family oxidoreductase [Pseudomonadales bacterium]
MKNLFDVSGKVAVVTGGSRGIGAMIARGLVENGVKTYITARKLDELKATAEALSTVGDCIALPSNLGSLEGVAAFAAAIRERESALHILVNNAGATWGAPIDEFPESGWDKVMDLNVKSLFFLTRDLLPALRAAGTAEDPARVINIGSINGLTHPHMDNYSYSASKAAVHHLTRHLGAELARQHVNVNGIAPGYFPSKMTAHFQDQMEQMASEYPRGRIGTAEDAAGTAIYLCSRASAWVTGHTIVLDGGAVAAT